MPTSAMLKKDEPPKQRVGSEEEDITKNDSVFVKLALLQSKDVFVSCNNHFPATLTLFWILLSYVLLSKFIHLYLKLFKEMFTLKQFFIVRFFEDVEIN